MNRYSNLLLLAAASLALGACARAEGSYPSLERRPAERLTATWPVAPPSPEAPPAPLDSATIGRLDALVSDARGADARFHGQQAHAESLVGTAGGAPMGSEAWSVATVAVSELEGARGQAMVAMADLDSLYAQATVEGRDASAIAKARDQVTAIIAEQDRVLDSLKRRMER
jgi:hypothetical protein